MKDISPSIDRFNQYHMHVSSVLNENNYVALYISKSQNITLVKLNNVKIYLNHDPA